MESKKRVRGNTLPKDLVSLGENVRCIREDETSTVYQLKDPTGEGLMTVYSVFPGINLHFNDFHIGHCRSHFQSKIPLFCIDHCREGRLEWEMHDGSCRYMEAGDLQMDSRRQHSGTFNFPLRHYHGITISICAEDAADVLSGILENFPVDVATLRRKFCRDDQPLIIRADPAIEHIFSELYSVPERIRIPFFQIKVLELLLFLSTLDIPPETSERPYLPKAQVKKTKAIAALITANPQNRYTLEELSAQFDFPITSMKKCFRVVYGTSIGAYMKTFRMNAAAIRLSRTKESITGIALRTGYENTSKFSASFKSVFGMTPSEYRKSAV